MKQLFKSKQHGLEYIPAVHGDCSWTAVYTRSRHEKKVHANLTQLGFESFLPTRKSIRHWSDRKKIIEEPIFPSYVFVKLNFLDRLRVFDSPGVVKFVEEKPGSPGLIPESQIISLKRFVEKDLKICACNENGDITSESNPNGSIENIAGITNKAGNVLGMMPHPERCAEEMLNGTQGKLIFESIISWLNLNKKVTGRA